MIGTTLGRYRIDALLAEGGMGTVYKAFDTTLGRPAAVKVLASNAIGNAEAVGRFLREARSASSLSHANVVRIYEVGPMKGGGYFIAMELVEGETLRTILERGKPPLPHAIEWMAQLADGIAAAHHAGIIHRDLKPENVVVSTTGSTKILDFGLAKFRAGMGTRRDRAVVLTTPGIVLGTVGYMAPEQALGHEIDHRTDLFAIGCILYECASGRYAFDGETAIDAMHRIIHGEPAPLTDAPPALQRVVARCLAKDPDQRYQSAKELAAALRALHHGPAS